MSVLRIPHSARTPGETSKQNGELKRHRRRSSSSNYRNEYTRLLTTQGNVVLAFFVSLIILLYYIFSVSRTLLLLHRDSNSLQPEPLRGIPNASLQSGSLNPANFHVVIPASKKDVNLCKVLLSAHILGYPTPTIINWDEEFKTDGLVEGGSHLAKITGVRNFLHGLNDTHDDDLVLMVDGYDVWMQLRPQTLLDRYFDINRRANLRIESEIGAATAKKHGIKQEVVFGCQKRCWPWTFDDPPCYAVPNSSLPNDIFGPQTDTPSDNEENPYINYRPRFLVSGTAIGSVRAFRKMFDQAKVQLEFEPNIGSDQYIFSHIFGDQEIWRETKRRDSLSFWKSSGPLHSHFNEKHIQEVRNKASSRPDQNFEFGIGIDYGSEIVINTVFAEDDTEWLRPMDTVEMTKAREQHKVPLNHRTTEFAADIDTSLPPFWTFSEEANLTRWTTWQDVNLFTNVFTGVQPAVIHHNAHRNGLKSLRETWWPLIWFQKDARVLLDAHIYSPTVPVARAGYDEQSMRDYWSYEIWKGGARSGSSRVESPGDGWIRFDDICREHHEELFRDGLGEWALPQAH